MRIAHGAGESATTTRPKQDFAVVSPHQRLVVLLVSALCALAVVRLVPFAAPMPGYWHDILQLARTGTVGQRFTPGGYALAMACGPVLFPAHPVLGFELEQVVLHVVLALALQVLLHQLGARTHVATIAALVLQADPELLSSVTKAWDVAFSSLLLVLLMVCLLDAAREGSSLGRSCVAGAVWAFGCFERPNYVFLAPVVLLAFWFGIVTEAEGQAASPSEQRRRGRAALQAMLGFCLLAGATYAGSGWAAWRSISLPQNGPYNLYAGNNVFSREALLVHLNGEPSIAPALAAAHVSLQGRTPDDASLQPFYRGASRAYVREHPAGAAGLAAIKLWTLLRPDTKVHALRSIAGAGKAALALTVPLWLTTVLLLAVRGRRWSRPDLLVLLTAALYPVPFLLTNADPRFRTPLDVLVTAHLVALWWPRGRTWA